MNTNTKLPEINQVAFTLAREQRGLSKKDLGGMACLSTRQIEQIENGETSSFYGAQVKFTAAKKVAKLLDLSEEEAFNLGVAPVVQVERETLAIADHHLHEEATKKEDTKAENADVNPKAEETSSTTLAVKEKIERATAEPVKKAPQSKPIAEVLASTATNQAPKRKSHKTLFLGLSLAAGLIFAVLNLRPLFFTEKPAEILLVKEEIIEPIASTNPSSDASLPTIPVSAAALAVPAPVIPETVIADTAGACPTEDALVTYKPEAPRKIADSVYIQVKTKQVVCVIDASGKIQNKVVEPGVGASFFGKPPFKVLTSGLTQVDVFFQGGKVRLANLNTKTLILESAEVVVIPVDKTDSLLR